MLHAPDAASASALVHRAEVKAVLAGLRDVSLLADESGISFADPSDANGANRFDASPVPSIRAAIVVHQRVEELLATVANARRAARHVTGLVPPPVVDPLLGVP
ncbi:MAG: hypothetical protein ACO1OB_06985 [Archangium sp.]